jgi:1-acyl-sn-glycerol-3-phosphate acyltransferase
MVGLYLAAFSTLRMRSMNNLVRRGIAGESQADSAPVELHGGFWVRPLCRLLALIYFGQPRVFGRANLPDGGALLISNHRSGAIDGMLLAQVAPRWTFMVGANLARHPIMRHLVAGLVVERVADQARLDPVERARRRAANLGALDSAAAFVAAGGALCICPEGTSALGPALLPLYPGVAAITCRLRALGSPGPLIPVGIHYAHGPALRGAVEVTIGAPIDLLIDDRLPPTEQRRVVLEQIRAALEAITVNVRDAEEQRAVEGLATLATAGIRLSHGLLCRALAHGLAAGDRQALHLCEEWRRLEAATVARRLARFAGAPLYPRGSMLAAALVAIPLAPIVAAAALISLPILFAAHAIAVRCADAPNVVALWRLLAGMPAALLWWPVLIVFLVMFAGGLAAPLVLIAAALTLAGLLLWRPWCIAAVMLINAVLAPDIGPAARKLREEALRWFVFQPYAGD